MRDRVLLYAIIVSVFAHILAVCVIGRSSASRLENAAVARTPRLVKVDFLSKTVPTKLPPVIQRLKPDKPPDPAPSATAGDHAASRPGRTTGAKSNGQRGGRGHSQPSNAGGPLDQGTLSANGDIAVGGPGKTPPGSVPGTGPDKGSGNQPGEGPPDPPGNGEGGPDTGASPPPPSPPPPKMVSVRICAASGLVPGQHCKQTREKSFVEGSQPTRRCDQCKPPHISRLADRELPELISGPSLRVPDSLEEGLTLKGTVAFYVDADGGVSGARMSKSSGNSALDRAAVLWVSQRKYKPAVQDGVPRRVPMTQPFTVRT